MGKPSVKWRSAVMWGFLILVFYLVSRLVNLTSIPIFTDEAIYIRWSQIGGRDAAWRFISLVDGKQPLFTWVMMALFRVLPAVDPLIVGRLVSVLAGFGSIIGIWFLGTEVFGKRSVGFLASILYLVYPFTLLYDRMALYDSMVAMFSIWNLYLAVLLARRLRLDIALILGMVLGVGMLNKTSGFISLYLLPTTVLLMDLRKKGRVERIVRWVGLAAIAVILSQAIYSILRLSPLFHMVSQKDAVFIYPFSDWITHPFRFLYGNLKGVFDWVITYLSWPVFLLSLTALGIGWKHTREKLVLYAWWLVPLVGLALFGKVLYPRFILFMTLPLLVLAAYTLSFLFSKRRITVWSIIIVIALLWVNIRTDFLLLTDPRSAPITRSDKDQYIQDWPSGGGVREVNTFLAEQSKYGSVTIFTEGTFGLLPYAIEIYQLDNPNVSVIGIWPLPKDPPEQMLVRAAQQPTFFLMNQEQIVPAGWPLELVAEYPKGGKHNRFMRLFRVVSPLAYSGL